MNWKQFKDAEEEIKLASGSKSISFGRVAQWSQQQPAEGGEDGSTWVKSATPFRLSLKQASKRRGVVAKDRPAQGHRPRDGGGALDLKLCPVPVGPRPVLSVILGNKAAVHPCWQRAVLKVWMTNNAVHWLCRSSAADDEAPSLSSLPLPTVEVRWQLKLIFPPFTLSELRFVMSGFGEIVSVRRVETNSALVVFRDLQGARRAVNSRRLGQPFCRLSCRWFFPALAQPNVFAAIVHQPTVPHPAHSCRPGGHAAAT